MTYHQLYRLLVPLYGDGEAKAVARMVYEVRFGLSLSDLLLGKDTQLSAADQAQLEKIAERLLSHEPVQQVLGYATFCGRRYKVNSNVLTPRPETEELCQWVIEEVRDKRQEVRDLSKEDDEFSVLDIGTGSGCIAITLATAWPEAQVTAWDISEKALRTAQQNALLHHVRVNFEKVDILTPHSSLPTPHSSLLTPHSSLLTPHLSLLISNPPYICRREAEQMERNVLDYEPHEALFVPDNDPLLFYRAIADFGRQSLKPGGQLFFEINPLYVTELEDLLRSMSYHDIESRHDAYGKSRMIRATR